MKNQIKTKILILTEDISSSRNFIKNFLIGQGWKECDDFASNFVESKLKNKNRSFMVFNDEYEVYPIHIKETQISKMIKDLLAPVDDYKLFESTDIRGTLEDYYEPEAAEILKKMHFDYVFVWIDIDDIDLSCISEVSTILNNPIEKGKLIISSPCYESIFDPLTKCKVGIEKVKLKSASIKRLFYHVVHECKGNKRYKTFDRLEKNKGFKDLLIQNINKFNSNEISHHIQEILQNPIWCIEEEIILDEVEMINKEIPTSTNLHEIFSDVLEIYNKNDLIRKLEIVLKEDV